MTAIGIPGLPAAALSSERNRFVAAGATDGQGDEVADGEEVFTEEEEDEMGDGWTSEEGAIKAAGTAMVSSSTR